MPRALSTYRLWLRGKPQTEVKAFGATPVPDEDRIYFHKKDDLSDRDITSAFLLSQIVGIDQEVIEASEGLSVERARAYLDMVALSLTEGVSGGNGANGPIIEADAVRDTGLRQAAERPADAPAAPAGDGSGDRCDGGGIGPGRRERGREEYKQYLEGIRAQLQNRGTETGTGSVVNGVSPHNRQ